MKIKRRRKIILRKPRPHQVKALKYCARTKHPALLMDMRLGKILVCSRHLKRSEHKKILVICPGAGIRSWIKELAKENEEVIHGYNLPKEKRVAAVTALMNTNRRQWLLMNPEAISSSPEIAGVAQKNGKWWYGLKYPEYEFDVVIA